MILDTRYHRLSSRYKITLTSVTVLRLWWSILSLFFHIYDSRFEEDYIGLSSVLFSLQFSSCYVSEFICTLVYRLLLGCFVPLSHPHVSSESLPSPLCLFVSPQSCLCFSCLCWCPPTPTPTHTHMFHVHVSPSGCQACVCFWVSSSCFILTVSRPVFSAFSFASPVSLFVPPVLSCASTLPNHPFVYILCGFHCCSLSCHLFLPPCVSIPLCFPVSISY